MTLLKRLKMQIQILLNENAFLPERFIFKGEDLLMWLRKEIRDIREEKKAKNKDLEQQE